MTTVVDSTLEEMTRRIAKAFDPSMIVLFGSRARGTHAKDSDYDLLIVMDECLDRRHAAVEIRRVLADIMAGKDVLVVTRSEYAAPAMSPILRDVLRDGQVVYRRN